MKIIRDLLNWTKGLVNKFTKSVIPTPPPTSLPSFAAARRLAVSYGGRRLNPSYTKKGPGRRHVQGEARPH